MNAIYTEEESRRLLPALLAGVADELVILDDEAGKRQRIAADGARDLGVLVPDRPVERLARAPGALRERLRHAVASRHPADQRLGLGPRAVGLGSPGGPWPPR